MGAGILPKALWALLGTGTAVLAVFFLVEWLVPAAKLRSDLPPCFEIGEPFHHRYRPLCQGAMDTPRGPVPLATNEDGLRELPRAEVLSHSRRVLVLGDSFVEGWWVRREEALAAELSRMLPDVYFINGGLRSTGPLFQSSYFPSMLEAYRPESVLLLLNETDFYDDRLACALSRGESGGFSTTDFQGGGWEHWLGRGRLSRWAQVKAYFLRWKRLTESEVSGRCGPCMGIRKIHKEAEKRNVPIFAFFLPLREQGQSGPYTVDGSAKEALLSCLTKLGVRYSAISWNEYGFSEEKGDFWPGDIHLTPEGNRRLAVRLAETFLLRSVPL